MPRRLPFLIYRSPETRGMVRDLRYTQSCKRQTKLFFRTCWMSALRFEPAQDLRSCLYSDGWEKRKLFCKYCSAGQFNPGPPMSFLWSRWEILTMNYYVHEEYGSLESGSLFFLRMKLRPTAARKCSDVRLSIHRSRAISPVTLRTLRCETWKRL